MRDSVSRLSPLESVLSVENLRVCLLLDPLGVS